MKKKNDKIIFYFSLPLEFAQNSFSLFNQFLAGECVRRKLKVLERKVNFESKMPCTKMNPDIKEERDKVSFNVEEFTNWFYGGAGKVEEKRFLGKFSNFKIKVQSNNL